MNDGISILLAVFLVLVGLRWMLGGSTPQQQRPQGSRSRQTHRVTPHMIEAVKSVVPDIPENAIEFDLGRTGSVELTINRALNGDLARLSHGTPNQPASSDNNGAGAKPYDNLVARYKIKSDPDHEMQEPPKVWEIDPEKRKEALNKRKEYVVLQARKKMLSMAAPPSEQSESSMSEKPE